MERQLLPELVREASRRDLKMRHFHGLLYHGAVARQNVK
jgi:hypothetical protein